MNKNKKEVTLTGNKTQIITVPIVFKNFIKKNGDVSNNKDIYIQRSIQDYFIKFCESKISRKELENKISKVVGEIKTLTLEVEFRKGNWDNCNENLILQSRIGEYVIIHKIISS